MFGLFNALKPAAPENKISLPAASAELIFPQQFMLKRMKWIVWNGRVGIVFDLSNVGVARIHLVNDIGVTTEERDVLIGELQLARYLDIPAPRRPANPADAAALGYC